MKKLIILLIFLLITPINLGITLFLLDYMKIKNSSISILPEEKLRLFASIPSSAGEIKGTFTVGDARPIIIERYLRKHHSPMLPAISEIIEASERYDVDYRLILAIAQCESNLCKKAPPGSYNCWGFENGATRFSSWKEALESVAKTLRERYINQGLTTPEEIMPKYAPPSVEKGGPWAKCVNQFMKELEYGQID